MGFIADTFSFSTATGGRSQTVTSTKASTDLVALTDAADQADAVYADACRCLTTAVGLSEGIERAFEQESEAGSARVDAIEAVRDFRVRSATDLVAKIDCLARLRIIKLDADGYQETGQVVEELRRFCGHDIAVAHRSAQTGA